MATASSGIAVHAFQERMMVHSKSVSETILQLKQVREEVNALLGTSRGGGSEEPAASATKVASCERRFTWASAWGVVGAVALIFNGLRKLIPPALEPFRQGNLTPLLWAQYVSFAAFMIYVKGYKVMQKKIAPLIVRRAYTLGEESPFWHKLLAPLYSWGFFHANKKRKIICVSFVVGMGAIIKVIKSLSYPYRSIVDAGVVGALSWGVASAVGMYVTALTTGRLPDIDPAFPSEKVA